MLSMVLIMEDDDRAPIDPAGPDLVYVTVANRIEKRIRAGEFGDSGRLPSENDLAEWYGVARMTIRRAARELTERGLVRVVPGKGTFITGQRSRLPPRADGWAALLQQQQDDAERRGEEADHQAGRRVSQAPADHCAPSGYRQATTGSWSSSSSSTGLSTVPSPR